MLKKNDGQIDIFNHMIFEKLIPKNHLLVKIDSIIDFSFVYEKIKDKYSDMGSGPKDPVMMVKILLLECLYRLSDVEVSDRINTDVAFRWFLGLGIDDAVLRDMKRNDTQAFEEASNKRFKVERRFATMVRNHGLRRCRYLRLKGAKVHIILANMVCNIVRMVNLIYPPSNAIPQV